MDDKLNVRFILCYLGLGAVVLASILGAVAFYQVQPVKHSVAKVEASLGDQDLSRLATKYISDQVVAQGFAVVKITILGTTQKGDTAKVTARVTVTDGTAQQTVKVVASFTRGIWSAQNLAAA